MDQSRFIRGLLDDPADPQQPQYVPANDFGPRAYGLLNTLFPDPYEAVGDAVRQYRGGDAVGAFETMFGAIPATGALKAAPKAAGIIAYHGSPHSFDKFDLSKIGTGEGAQAYGHGLYFAESEPVARSYRDALAVKNDPREGINNLLDNVGFGVQRGDVESHAAGLGLPNLSKAQLDDIYAALKGRNSDGTISDSGLDAIRRLDRSLPPAGKGSMYQVRIDADPNAFLDWDKPLSEQSQYVKDALSTNLTTLRDNTSIHRPRTPEDAKRLREAGIPGIKYLDQGSRVTSGGELLDVFQGPNGWQSRIKVSGRGGAGFSTPTDSITTSKPFASEAEARAWADSKINSGSRNYVVFDDSLIDILKKYGLIGLLGGGAAASGMSGMNNPAAAGGGGAPGL